MKENLLKAIGAVLIFLLAQLLIAG